MATDQQIVVFQKVVWDYFAAHGRHDLPWRLPEADSSFDPYKILVSEIMLQQTQVGRVWPKYEAFLQAFPTVQDLAAAPLGDVLIAWQGLGYNRRAKFLWQAAQRVVNDFDSMFPHTQAELTTLPGVGTNTAGAIMAYAYDAPVAFVETNIRTVFIHHFFQDQTGISDKEILELVKLTLPQEGKEQPNKMYSILPSSDREKPLGLSRMWYWALMDYGVHLKQSVGNLSRASKSYAKQSAFEGSLRQIRGHVLRLLSDGPRTSEDLAAKITDKRLSSVLQKLEQEELIKHRSNTYGLS